jgi:hypothetical protein
MLLPVSFFAHSTVQIGAGARAAGAEAAAP